MGEEREHKEIWGNDRIVLYHDCVGGYTTVCVCENNWPLGMVDHNVYELNLSKANENLGWKSDVLMEYNGTDESGAQRKHWAAERFGSHREVHDRPQRWMRLPKERAQSKGRVNPCRTPKLMGQAQEGDCKRTVRAMKGKSEMVPKKWPGGYYLSPELLPGWDGPGSHGGKVGGRVKLMEAAEVDQVKREQSLPWRLSESKGCWPSLPLPAVLAQVIPGSSDADSTEDSRPPPSVLTEPGKLWPHYCKGRIEKRNREVKRNRKGGRGQEEESISGWKELQRWILGQHTPHLPHTHTSKAEKLRPRGRKEGSSGWVLTCHSFIWQPVSDSTLWSAYPGVKVK